MGIDICISNQVIKKWFLQIISEIDISYDFVIHNSLETLYSTIIPIISKRILIIDIEDRAGVEYFNSISSSFENIKIIAIGLEKPIPEVLKFIGIGFKGYIDFSFTTAEVYQIINKVNNGATYLSSSQQDILLNHVIQKDNLENTIQVKPSGEIKQTIKALTEKERRVFELLITGLSYKEIANAIGVSSFTINQRVKVIYKKLDVRSRGELSFRYLSN